MANLRSPPESLTRSGLKIPRSQPSRGLVLGWFRPVHCKSLPAQKVRALLTTRKLLQAKRHDVEMSLRGVLRGFGLKVGPTTLKTFEGRVQDLVAQHDTLQTIADALLKARVVLEQEFKAIEKRLYRLARSNEPTRRG